MPRVSAGNAKILAHSLQQLLAEPGWAFSHGLQRLGLAQRWLTAHRSCSAGTASPLPSPALALPALQEEAKLKCQELQRALRTVGSGGSVGEGGEPRLEMTGLKLFLHSCIPRKVGGLCGAAPGAGRVEGICGSS